MSLLSVISLGHIVIDRGRVIADVNSAERAAALREIIERALGAGARHRATEIELIEQVLAEGGTDAETSAEAQAEHDALMELPEVKVKVREMLARHYEDWVTQKIPALGDRTPLEAMNEANGREKVEALLKQIERDVGTRDLLVDEDVILRLRERLGLC